MLVLVEVAGDDALVLVDVVKQAALLQSLQIKKTLVLPDCASRKRKSHTNARYPTIAEE